MQTLNPTTTTAADDADIRIGTRLGDLRVLGIKPQRLTLGSPQWLEKFFICAAGACFVIGPLRLIIPHVFGTPLAAPNWAKDWGFVLICAGLGMALVSFRDFRRWWTFDADAGAATRKLGFTTRTWQTEELSGISARVRHVGPDEVLVLALDTPADAVEVARAPSDRRGLALPPAAAHVAKLLDLPLRRMGRVVQGGPEVCEALDRVGTLAAEADGDANATSGNDGHDIVINCPACKRAHVPAVSYEHHEQYHGVTRDTTWVKCLECGTHLYSKLSWHQLVGLTPERLAEVVVFRLSLIGRVTALLAVILCLFPWVGMGMALLATLINWRTRGWPKTLSRIALAISVIPTVGVTILVSK